MLVTAPDRAVAVSKRSHCLVQLAYASNEPKDTIPRRHAAARGPPRVLFMRPRADSRYATLSLPAAHAPAPTGFATPVPPGHFLYVLPDEGRASRSSDERRAR